VDQVPPCLLFSLAWQIATVIEFQFLIAQPVARSDSMMSWKVWLPTEPPSFGRSRHPS
jgi:hypothetical protein